MNRIFILLLVFVLFWKICTVFGGIFNQHVVTVEQYNEQLKKINVVVDSAASFGTHQHFLLDKKKVTDDCTNGLYLGNITDPSTDCSSICANSHFKYIDKGDLLYMHDTHLRVGGWCLPSGAVNCNPSTTFTVKTLEGWSCISRFSEFGGPGGNRILVCGGQISDNLLGEDYVTNIPSTLVMSGPDERLEDDGSWRFTCTKNIDPSTGNIYKSPPWSHLEQIKNVCVSGLRNSVDIELDWETGTCNCAKYNLHSAYGKCIVCLEGEFKNFSDYPYRYNVPLDCDDYGAEFEPGKVYTNMPCASPAYNCINMPLDYSFGAPVQLYWQRVAMNTKKLT